MVPAPIFIADFLHTWEDGGLTDPGARAPDPRDDGNWTGGRRGCGALVGSTHGVTPAVLARHRGVPVERITRADMRALTMNEAASIALADFYRGPGFDRLAWNRITASVVDFGYTAGQGEARLLVQHLIGATPDGDLGPATVAAFAAFVGHWGEEHAARLWAATRDNRYDQVIRERPADRVFHDGWNRRTDSYLPGTTWWRMMESAR